MGPHPEPQRPPFLHVQALGLRDAPTLSPPDPVGTGVAGPCSQVTLKAGLFTAPAVTFLLRPLAQEAQDSPPSCAVPSPGSDLRPYNLGHLGSDRRTEGPFPGQVAFWPLPEPRLLLWSSGGDADGQPVPGASRERDCG